MHLYDIDSDQEAELVVGWTNGKLDFRRVETGEVYLSCLQYPYCAKDKSYR